jgi:hypothetical protein
VTTKLTVWLRPSPGVSGDWPAAVVDDTVKAVLVPVVAEPAPVPVELQYANAVPPPDPPWRYRRRQRRSSC